MQDRVQVIFAENEMRMIADGVAYADLVRVRQRVRSWNEWYRGWAELALEYEQLGDEAHAAGFNVTAGERYWQASIYWHYAQFLWFERPQEREDGQRRKAELYQKGAPLLQPPAERVEIPFDGTRIPGYVRLPQGVERAPCVILIGGLESTKEESYTFENLCLRRGLATFAFDGPGQGEYFFQRPLGPDFEVYTSRVVDYLMTRSDIDADRLAVLGRALGGNMAVRSAAFDERLKGCVVFGVLYDLSFFDELDPLKQAGFRYITGIADPAAARDAIMRYVDLDGIPERVNVPLYVLHGAKDPMFPLAHAHRLAEAARHAPCTLVIEEEGTHCAHNLYQLVRPRMADWLVEQLRS
jgi:2,6-dihydroxypseudooxynicotine hydrolase